MRKRYQQIDRIKALQALDANGGNIALTAVELEIPLRTLRDWDLFRQAIAKAFFIPKEKPELVYPRPLDEEVEEVPEVVQELQVVREKMMRAINHLTEKLDVDDGLIHRRAMAFSRLIDRLNKVDEQIIAWHNVVGNKVVRIEYVHEGVIDDRPPYQRRAEEKEQLEAENMLNDYESLKNEPLTARQEAVMQEQIEAGLRFPHDRNWYSEDNRLL